MASEVLTHRIIRYTKEAHTTTTLIEGRPSVESTEYKWRVHCACTEVFVGDTEMEVTGRYLAHLPKPKGE